MKCLRCGFENPDYLEFCQNCSAPLHKNGEDANHPTWGFVKAPTWTEPDFSADSVSEDDVPADFVSEMETARKQQEAARRAAAAEAAAAAEKARAEAQQAAARRQAAERTAAEAARRQAEERAAAEAARAAEEARIADNARKAEEAAASAQRRAAEDARAAQRRAEQERLIAERRAAELAEQETARRARRPIDQNDAESIEKAGSGLAFGGLLNRRDKAEKAEKPVKAEKAAKPRYDEYDDFDANYSRKAYKNGKRGGNGNGLGTAIKVVAVIAALALLGVAAYFLINGLKSCSGTTPTGTAKEPSIEVNPDKEGYYLVTVPAKEGKVLIYETEDGRRSEVTVDSKNYVKFNVPASSLMTVEPVDGAIYEAKPKVYIRNDDGTESLIENWAEGRGSVMLPVPEIAISYNNPDNIVSEDGKVEISGHIDLIGTELNINGEPVSINQDGSFAHEVVYEDTGDYTIPVVGRLGGYQVYNHNFNVTVNAATPAENLIQLPWEYGDTTYTQRVKSSVDTVEIRGMIPVGASIEASCDSSNAALTVPTVNEDGTFSFNAKLAYPGDYTVHLVCTSESGQISERDIHVQRAPEYSKYLNNAWQMNFASFAYESTQGYNLKGTVTEILKSDDYILARMELTDGNVLIIEYHNHYGSAGLIEEGKSYEGIYGRPMGLNEEGEVQFYVWFVED